MATPPNLHCICDDCWKKSNPGQNGILPSRVHVVQLRECCACGAKTASGIFIDDDPLLYRCKGIHPMTDQELRATMASFFRQAVSVAERTCILKHSLAADRARHTVAAALTDVLVEYSELHGIPRVRKEDDELARDCRAVENLAAFDPKQAPPRQRTLAEEMGRRPIHLLAPHADSFCGKATDGDDITSVIREATCEACLHLWRTAGQPTIDDPFPEPAA